MLISKVFSLVFPVNLVRLSIFNLGFSSEKGKTSTEQSTNTTRNQDQTGQQTTTGTQQESVTTLDPEVQKALTDILTSLAKTSGDTVDQAQPLVDLLTQRAAGAETATKGDIAAIIAEQERAGQQQIGRLFTDLSQQVGSSQGSLVRQAAAEGQASLASQLAGTEGGLNLQARQGVTQEIMAALQGVGVLPQLQGAETANLANLANVLKGATTTGTTTTNQNVTTEQQLQDIITSLTSGSSKSKSSGFKLGFGF